MATSHPNVEVKFFLSTNLRNHTWSIQFALFPSGSHPPLDKREEFSRNVGASLAEVISYVGTAGSQPERT